MLHNELTSFVPMATYWVPDLPDIKGFAGHLYNTILFIFTILYLTTQHPGVIRNSFKHVRETKSIENKRNSLKLPL